jgi:SP family facilitated glucose transporter-like MFS transporter 3
MNVHSSNVESPLLNPSSPTSDTQLPLRDLLSNTALRGPTILCAVIMALQQFGGINAVMFYSTPVLRPLLPNAAGLLGIGITLVNAIMTLPAIFLVDVSPTVVIRSLTDD